MQQKAPIEIDVEEITSSDSEESDAKSACSDDFFTDNRDDLICWGELMKFKPGLTVNFISRYV